MIFARSEAILWLISIIFAWSMPEIIHGAPIHSSAISEYEEIAVHDDYGYSSSLEDIKGADYVWDVLGLDVSAVQEQDSFNKQLNRQAHEIYPETAENNPIHEPISAFDLTTPPLTRPAYVRPIPTERTVQDMIDKIVIFKNNTENPHVYHEHDITMDSDELIRRIYYPETPAVEVRKQEELVPNDRTAIAELVYEGSTDRKREKRSVNLHDLDMWETIATNQSLSPMLKILISMF